MVAGCGGNRALLGEVIDIFLVDGPQLMTTIRQAAERRDPQALAAASHALKGSAGLLGQHGAYQTAKRLEQMGKSTDLTTTVDELCTTLEGEMADLATALRTLREALV